MSTDAIVETRRESAGNARATNVYVTGLGFTEVAVTVPTAILDTPAMWRMIRSVLDSQLATRQLTNEAND